MGGGLGAMPLYGYMVMDDTPNYSEYSLASLEDVLINIDKDIYPDRVNIIESEIKIRKATLKSEVEQVQTDEKLAGRGTRLGAQILDGLILMIPPLILMF